jgi:molybdate transport system ATP-binding protein
VTTTKPAGAASGTVLVALREIHLTLGSRVVFAGLTLTCNVGQHLAIFGENGSGKSALLRIMAGELWPDRSTGSREYTINSVTTTSPIIARPSLRRVSPEIQERFLRLGFAFTVAEVLLAGIDNTDYIASEYGAAAQQRLEYIADIFGLRSFLQKEVRSLSHGTIRRVFIARACMPRPALLALDEAMDGLDSAYENVVREALSEIAREGTTMVCVTHRPISLPPEVVTAFEIHDKQIRPLKSAKTYMHKSVVQQSALKPTNGNVESLALLRDVSVRYEDDVAVLENIDWELQRGVHWAITGANGSGKSTLAEVLAGITPVANGVVERFGSPERMNLWDIRREFVLISDREQMRYDWPIPVREVVASGYFSSIGVVGEMTSEQWHAVDAILQKFQLADIADRELTKLSFGQRRRVLIARAMVVCPSVILLDEGFDGLDHASRQLLTEQLALVAETGTTIVVIAHDPRDIPAFIQKTIHLESGRITE